jgi:hypothetical protein
VQSAECETDGETGGRVDDCDTLHVQRHDCRVSLRHPPPSDQPGLDRTPEGVRESGTVEEPRHCTALTSRGTRSLGARKSSICSLSRRHAVAVRSAVVVRSWWTERARRARVRACRRRFSVALSTQPRPSISRGTASLGARKSSICSLPLSDRERGEGFLRQHSTPPDSPPRRQLHENTRVRHTADFSQENQFHNPTNTVLLPARSRLLVR